MKLHDLRTQRSPPLTSPAPTILPSRPRRLSHPLWRDAPPTHPRPDRDLLHIRLHHQQDRQLPASALVWLRHLDRRLWAAVYYLTDHLDGPTRRIPDSERGRGRADVPDESDCDPGECREEGDGGGDRDAEFLAAVGWYGGAGWVCCYS